MFCIFGPGDKSYHYFEVGMKLAFLMKNPKLQEILINAYVPLHCKTVLKGNSLDIHFSEFSMFVIETLQRCHLYLNVEKARSFQRSPRFLKESPIFSSFALFCGDALRTRFNSLLSLSFSLGEANRSSFRKAVPSHLAQGFASTPAFCRLKAEDLRHGCHSYP